MAQARLESSLDPDAQAPTSSAAGLYQFTRGTWLETVGQHAGKHGLGWMSAAAADPAARAQVLALRNDPDAAALMAGELANDNRAALSSVLGREPDAAELYLGHFLGAGGASRFLKELAANPGRAASEILPQAAAANRTIFFAGGQPRSVGEVMHLMRGKMASAMAADGNSYEAGFPLADRLAAGSRPARANFVPGGPIAREWHSARAQLPQVEPRSMAQTLSASFGAEAGAADAHVRSAYAKFAKFGL
jgi:hypothetical protein